MSGAERERGAQRALHSVTLDKDKCLGCTTCLKECPTEAIRVRKGKARIIDERCVDCGECIRACPHGAKRAAADSLSSLADFEYRVAIPAPVLYGQFDGRFSTDRILSGLIELGFDDAVEVAAAAEYASVKTAELIATGDGPLPLISASCPAVVRLIQVRYPSLIGNLVRIASPMELAAKAVREVIHADKKGLGIFFITPCAAKVTAVRSPLGVPRVEVDRAIPIKDIYVPLRNVIAGAGDRNLAEAGGGGIGWARTEGESEAVGERRRVSVDGIWNVIGVFEALENGKLKDLAFIEASACPAGCVGGPLVVENPYIARQRLRDREWLARAAGGRVASALASLKEWRLTESIPAKPAMMLDRDVLRAMIMMEEMELTVQDLPGLDCGSCGAPSCRALAEDIAKGLASKTDCVFKLRDKVRRLAEELMTLENLQPPGLDKEED